MKNIHIISDNLFQSVKMLWDWNIKIQNLSNLSENKTKQNNFVERQEEKHTHPPPMLVLLKLASRGQCNPSQCNPLLILQIPLGLPYNSVL